jgi:hypothetical protein
LADDRRACAPDNRARRRRGRRRSATDRTRSPCRSRVVHLAPSTEPSASDRTKRARAPSPEGDVRRNANRHFRAPSEHSLRGRNTQDRRVLNELTPVRIYRSGSPTPTDYRACRTRTRRASLGRALAIAPLRETRRRRPATKFRTFELSSDDASSHIYTNRRLARCVGTVRRTFSFPKHLDLGISGDPLGSPPPRRPTRPPARPDDSAQRRLAPAAARRPRDRRADGSRAPGRSPPSETGTAHRNRVPLAHRNRSVRPAVRRVRTTTTATDESNATERHADATAASPGTPSVQSVRVASGDGAFGAP